MNQDKLQQWSNGEFAQAFFAREREPLLAFLRQAVGPSTLVVGGLFERNIIKQLDLPLVIRTAKTPSFNADCLADSAFLPFAPEAFSSVLLPHVLEGATFAHQVLREAHRVLTPEGHLVLTGFNPISALGLQRYLYPASAYQGRYYTVRRVKDWLQLLNFEITASRIFHYAPLSRNQESTTILESVGDRWLPMCGAGYIINAKKKHPAYNFVGRANVASASSKLTSSPSAANTAVKSSQPKLSK